MHDVNTSSTTSTVPVLLDLPACAPVQTQTQSGKGLEVAAPAIRGAVGKVAGVEVGEPWPRRARACPFGERALG